MPYEVIQSCVTLMFLYKPYDKVTCATVSKAFGGLRLERRWDDNPDVLSHQLAHALVGGKTPLTKSDNPGIQVDARAERALGLAIASGLGVVLRLLLGLCGALSGMLHPKNQSGNHTTFHIPIPYHSQKNQNWYKNTGMRMSR